MNVLMVCLGNICRSPVADGLMRIRANEAGMSMTVDSCGTSANHTDEAPDPRSQQSCVAHGVDISSLRARQFEQGDFEKFDMILCMDKQNLRDIKSLTDNDDYLKKVHLFNEAIAPGQNIPVPDPYFGGEGGFEKVFQMADKGCQAWIDKWKEQ